MNRQMARIVTTASVLPLLAITTALASPSAQTEWQNAVNHSEKATNQQLSVSLSFNATVNMKPKAQSISTSVALTSTSEVKGKRYVQFSTLLERLPGSTSVAKMYDQNGQEYVNEGSGWKKNGPSDTLTGTDEILKVSGKWKTNSDRTAIKNGYEYKFHVGLPQLDPMVYAGVTSISTNPAWTEALKQASILVGADTRNIDGSERVSVETVNVKLHLTGAQVKKIFGDVSSAGSTNTVTKSVYGTGSDTTGGTTANVSVTEIIKFGYGKLSVSVPTHLPK